MKVKSIDLSSLLEVTIRVAQNGAKVVSEGIGHGTAIPKGSAGDVVTEVDRKAESHMRNLLADLRPYDRIVGEEYSDSGSDKSGISWYLDPIDGTSNFVHGLDLYCTSVAAFDRHNQQWLTAAVTLPTSGVTYLASQGKGAYKLHPDGDKEPIFARRPKGTPRLLGIGLSYDPQMRHHQLEDIAKRMKSYDDMRSLGTAAYALCLVADGTLSAFVELDLFVYDWAGGALIAEEAGAEIIRPEKMNRGAILAFGK